MNRRIPTRLVVAAIMAALVAAVVGLILLGVALPFDPESTTQGSTRASLVVTLFGTLTLAESFAILLFFGLDDVRRGRRVSPLLWPVLAIAAALSCYLFVTSGIVTDFLAHDLRPTWGAFYTPFIRVVQAAFLLAIFGGFVWFNGVLLHGRDIAGRRIVALYATIVLATAAVVAAVLLLADRGVI